MTLEDLKTKVADLHSLVKSNSSQISSLIAQQQTTVTDLSAIRSSMERLEKKLLKFNQSLVLPVASTKITEDKAVTVSTRVNTNELTGIADFGRVVDDLSSKVVHVIIDKEYGPMKEDAVATLISDSVVVCNNHAIHASAMILDSVSMEDFVDQVEVPIAWEFRMVNEDKDGIMNRCIDLIDNDATIEMASDNSGQVGQLLSISPMTSFKQLAEFFLGVAMLSGSNNIQNQRLLLYKLHDDHSVGMNYLLSKGYVSRGLKYDLDQSTGFLHGQHGVSQGRTELLVEYEFIVQSALAFMGEPSPLISKVLGTTKKESVASNASVCQRPSEDHKELSHYFASLLASAGLNDMLGISVDDTSKQKQSRVVTCVYGLKYKARIGFDHMFFIHSKSARANFDLQLTGVTSYHAELKSLLINLSQCLLGCHDHSYTTFWSYTFSFDPGILWFLSSEINLLAKVIIFLQLIFLDKLLVAPVLITTYDSGRALMSNWIRSTRLLNSVLILCHFTGDFSAYMIFKMSKESVVLAIIKESCYIIFGSSARYDGETSIGVRRLLSNNSHAHPNLCLSLDASHSFRFHIMVNYRAHRVGVTRIQNALLLVEKNLLSQVMSLLVLTQSAGGTTRVTRSPTLSTAYSAPVYNVGLVVLIAALSSHPTHIYFVSRYYSAEGQTVRKQWDFLFVLCTVFLLPAGSLHCNVIMQHTFLAYCFTLLPRRELIGRRLDFCVPGLCLQYVSTFPDLLKFSHLERGVLDLQAASGTVLYITTASSELCMDNMTYIHIECSSLCWSSINMQWSNRRLLMLYPCIVSCDPGINFFWLSAPAGMFWYMLYYYNTCSSMYYKLEMTLALVAQHIEQGVYHRSHRVLLQKLASHCWKMLTPALLEDPDPPNQLASHMNIWLDDLGILLHMMLPVSTHHALSIWFRDQYCVMLASEFSAVVSLVSKDEHLTSKRHIVVQHQGCAREQVSLLMCLHSLTAFRVTQPHPRGAAICICCYQQIQYPREEYKFSIKHIDGAKVVTALCDSFILQLSTGGPSLILYIKSCCFDPGIICNNGSVVIMIFCRLSSDICSTLNVHLAIKYLHSLFAAPTLLKIAWVSLTSMFTTDKIFQLHWGIIHVDCEILQDLKLVVHGMRSIVVSRPTYPISLQTLWWQYLECYNIGNFDTSSFCDKLFGKLLILDDNTGVEFLWRIAWKPF